MSRSYRKPYCSWANTAGMRNDKKMYHRKHRAKVREAIKTTQDLDELHTPIKNIETSNVWCMAHDGNQCYVEPPKEHDDEWYKNWYKKIKRK